VWSRYGGFTAYSTTGVRFTAYSTTGVRFAAYSTTGVRFAAYSTAGVRFAVYSTSESVEPRPRAVVTNGERRGRD
jgi:hypothetical protein